MLLFKSDTVLDVLPYETARFKRPIRGRVAGNPHGTGPHDRTKEQEKAAPPGGPGGWEGVCPGPRAGSGFDQLESLKTWIPPAFFTSMLSSMTVKRSYQSWMSCQPSSSSKESGQM